MLKDLINEKINEVFLEYQKANGITSGDIRPEDTLILDNLQEALEHLVERVCSYQPKEINFDNYFPSWYVYTDCDGDPHSAVFVQITKNQFFTKVSRMIAFDDLDDTTVQKIYYKGKEVEYAGWQPCMRFEYKDLDGNTVWVGEFPEWDH